MGQMSWEEGISIFGRQLCLQLYGLSIEREGVYNSKWQEHKGSKAQGSVSEAFQMPPSRAEQFISHQDLHSKSSCYDSPLWKGWWVFLYLDLGGEEQRVTVHPGYKACVLTGEPEGSGGSGLGQAHCERDHLRSDTSSL